MRYSTLDEVLELQRLILAQSGGSAGVRDRGALDSAVAQPRMTFGGQDLYPTFAEKAAALGFSLVKNHPFVRWQQANRSRGGRSFPSAQWP